MALLSFDEQSAQWFDVDIEPFVGDVRLKIKPSTRALLDEVQIRAKQNPKSRRHTVTEPGGKRVTREGDPAKAWIDELLIAVVEDWEGVDGNPPCDDENKPKLSISSALVNWIIAKASDLAGAKVEASEGN